jgi:hypothetical protein
MPHLPFNYGHMCLGGGGWFKSIPGMRADRSHDSLRESRNNVRSGHSWF